MQLIVVIALIGVAMLQPTKSQNITEPKKAITPRALPNQGERKTIIIIFIS